jgi:hypothetical protein
MKNLKKIAVKLKKHGLFLTTVWLWNHHFFETCPVSGYNRANTIENVMSIKLTPSTTTGSPICFCMAALLYLHHLEENANIVKLSFPILKIIGKTVWLKTHPMFL